mmetsp:Transcript_128919/g.412857  ORF Transcript_128919/g.412857 Transcript_128919/m.412857 type:complete len:226 (+) Transcript_128919:372-1049(+)
MHRFVAGRVALENRTQGQGELLAGPAGCPPDIQRAGGIHVPHGGGCKQRPVLPQSQLSTRPNTHVCSHMRFQIPLKRRDKSSHSRGALRALERQPSDGLHKALRESIAVNNGRQDLAIRLPSPLSFPIRHGHATGKFSARLHFDPDSPALEELWVNEVHHWHCVVYRRGGFAKISRVHSDELLAHVPDKRRQGQVQFRAGLTNRDHVRLVSDVQACEDDLAEASS